MIVYYYDLGQGEIYHSNRNIDYRMLCKSVRCLKITFGNVQVLKDNRSIWYDYPIDDKELSWIVLKSKDIPRSWAS